MSERFTFRRTIGIASLAFGIAACSPGLFDGVYVSATRETATGDVILKLVNVQSVPQALRIAIRGVQTIRPEARGETMSGAPTDVNTVAEPTKVVPRPLAIRNAGTTFPHELPAHSVSVIRLKTR